MIRNSFLKGEAALALGLVLVLLVTVWLYWPGLNGPMMLDDYPQLGALLNASPGDLAHWRQYVESGSGLLGRPVAMSTFLLNALTWGPDLSGWKYTNLMIHLVTGLIMFRLAAALLMQKSEISHSHATAWRWALLVAALWLLHPLNVSTVLYTVQRMAQLSTLFCVAGMLSYVIGRRRQLERRPHGHFLVILTYALFMPLAMFSKENGALLPVFTLLLEWYLFRFQGDRTARRLVIISFLAVLVVPAIFIGTYLAEHYQTTVLARYERREFTLSERLLTEQRVLVMYVAEILAPSLGKYGFLHDDITLSTGWLSPPSTLYCGLVLLALGISAVAIRKRLPVAGLGIAIFLAGHSIESTVIPLELMFEHRNYLPAFGLLLAAADVLRTVGLPSYVKAFVVFAMLALWSVVLAQHVSRWSSYPRLMTYISREHPESPRVKAAIAEYLTEQGKYEAALGLLAGEAIPGARLQSLYIRCKQDQSLPPEALRKTEEALTRPLDSYASSGVMEVARAGMDGCRFDESAFLGLLDVALSKGFPDRKTEYKVLIYKAHYLWRRGESEKAIASLMNTQKMLPDDPVPLFLASEWLISLNEISRAHVVYERAVQIAAQSNTDYSTFVASVGSMFSHPEAAAHWRERE